jgi:predicted O-methyltransferase YrrM
VAGRLDPSVPILLGRLQFDAADEIFARDVGEVLFRHHNVTECARQTVGTPLIGQIYASGVVAAADGEHRAIYPWSIPASVGFALRDLIRRRGLGRTLEIGMAYGLATLFMCEAHRERGTGRHTAIDPCQRLEFRGLGLLNLERAGLASLLECIEEEDARALPDLERRGDRFDLVFIDGLHMFDYTLLDFFHADRLARVGGCIAFDDAQAPGVQRAIDFIRENRSYRVVDVGVERLTVLEKLEDDTRSLVNPNHHRVF